MPGAEHDFFREFFENFHVLADRFKRVRAAAPLLGAVGKIDLPDAELPFAWHTLQQNKKGFSAAVEARVGGEELDVSVLPRSLKFRAVGRFIENGYFRRIATFVNGTNYDHVVFVGTSPRCCSDRETRKATAPRQNCMCKDQDN